MKYQKIYDVLHQHPDICVNDRSYWRFRPADYIAIMHPLNIIVEAPKVGLRIWINHADRRYSISTADLTLNCASREYSQSFQHYSYHNQTSMACKLQELFRINSEENHANN